MKLAGLREDQGLVFATEAGTPINPSNLRQRSLAPLLKKAGLSAIRFHDLRHTCATLLLSNNTPEVRAGASRTRHYSDNAGHLFSRRAWETTPRVQWMTPSKEKAPRGERRRRRFRRIAPPVSSVSADLRSAPEASLCPIFLHDLHHT
jgi:hypothetical protein